MNINKKYICIISAIVCAVVMMFCVIRIMTYKNEISVDENEFNSLKNLVGEEQYSPPATTSSNEFSIKNENIVAGEIIGNVEPDIIDKPGIEIQDNIIIPPTIHDKKPEIVKDYNSLKNLSSNFVGWLSIPGTKLDYPVMQTNDNPDYYLRRNFYGRYSDLGTPYAEEGNNIEAPDDNIIIYGHHMKNGLMFGDLEKYKKESFYKKHKYIKFDTLNKNSEYEIVAVLKTVVYTEKPDEFKYWEFMNAKNSKDFDKYIKKIKELSLYDIETSAKYGDKLITLSTCEYSQTNGRLLVVAKLIS